MKIFIYILKLFSRNTIGVLSLCLFMYLLSDYLERYSRLFERYNASLLEIVEFYLCAVPFQIIQFIPISALVGSVATLIGLNRSGEIVAMRAAGVGPFRIGKPIFFGGILLTSVSILMSHFVIPQAAYHQNNVIGKLKGETRAILSDRKWMRDGNWFYSYDSFDVSTRSLKGVRGIRFSKVSHQIDKLWIAKRANYDDESELWSIEDKTDVNLVDERLIAYEKADSKTLDLPYKTKLLFKDTRDAVELSYTELIKKVAELRSTGSEYRRYEVALHVKFGYCFASLLLPLLGLKFGFSFERNVLVMRSIFATFGVGIGYWFILSTVRAFSLTGITPAWSAGWIANFFIFLVLGYELKKLNSF